MPIYAVDDNVVADLHVKVFNGRKCVVVPDMFGQGIVRAYPVEQVFKVRGKGVNLDQHSIGGERVILLPDDWKFSHAKLVKVRKVIE